MASRWGGHSLSGGCGLSQPVIWVLLDSGGGAGLPGPWPHGTKEGGGGNGDAAEAKVEAANLRRDRHLGKDGAVPGQSTQGAGAVGAVFAAAFDVLDHVEDLLALRLPQRPSEVQDGRYVFLPVEGERENMSSELKGRDWLVAAPRGAELPDVGELSHQDRHLHLHRWDILQLDDL